MENTPTHSEVRKTNFQHFRGKSSCERTERYFFNGLQIQLHKNWPEGELLLIINNRSAVHVAYIGCGAALCVLVERHCCCADLVPNLIVSDK